MGGGVVGRGGPSRRGPAPRRTWQPARPREAAEWLRDAGPAWWIAGGHALDLFLGEASRPHGDLDVGCFRDDLAALRRPLDRDGWELFAARDRRLTRLAPGVDPHPAAHSVWCRPGPGRDFALEVLLDERAGSDWCFRRRPEIRLPADAIVWHAEGGLRVLRPEIQLLFKAKGLRPRDAADFTRVAPRLGPEARAWLRDALGRAHPGHAWRDRL